ncbi:MAG TPA: VOC family protein [Chthoniobacteraceae bacterium]|jgi:PhnB protein
MTTPNSTLQPYLFFGGRCEEALEFYRTALGAEIGMLMRYKECPDPMPEGMLAPGFEEKVMHASFNVGDNLVMASDGCGGPDEPGFGGFSLSLTLPTEAEVERVFAALAEGGQVSMPLMKTFWSPKFGMLTDRFGLGWMVTVPVEETRP